MLDTSDWTLLSDAAPDPGRFVMAYDEEGGHFRPCFVWQDLAYPLARRFSTRPGRHAFSPTRWIYIGDQDY